VAGSRLKGSYGIDAPYLLAVPAAAAVAGVAQAAVSGSPWPLAGVGAVLACAGLGLHASSRGKFVVWEELLDHLDLRGDERVLDVGCGRGAVLLLAARRLTTGRAVGVDLWRATDQSGNSERSTRRNAEIEGFADRVELRTADMMALPFDDETFDVVVSNVAVHNMRGAAARDRAVDEAVRVLRPGGRLLIADIAGTRRYVARLTRLGMAGVTRRGLGWRMWWSGPWLATRLVSATKPRCPAAPSGPLPGAGC